MWFPCESLTYIPLGSHHCIPSLISPLEAVAYSHGTGPTLSHSHMQRQWLKSCGRTRPQLVSLEPELGLYCASARIGTGRPTKHEHTNNPEGYIGN